MKNSPLKRYYPLLWEIRATFGGGILAGIIYGIASGFGLPTMVNKVFPLLFRDENKMNDVPLWVIDFQQKWLDGSVESLTLVMCMLIPLIFLIRGASGYANTYLINKSGFLVLERIRTMAFAKLQRLPMSYYHGNKSGDLLSRLTYDCEATRNAIAQGTHEWNQQYAKLNLSL